MFGSFCLTFGLPLFVDLSLLLVPAFAVLGALASNVDETRLVEVVQEGQNAGVYVVLRLGKYSNDFFLGVFISNYGTFSSLGLRVGLCRGFSFRTTLRVVGELLEVLLSDTLTLNC
jgi:hypothetical protein